MDDLGGIAVEFKEREARAVLAALAISGYLAKREPQTWERIVRHALEQLSDAAFAGPRQWRADELSAGMRVWRALGLGGSAGGDGTLPTTK
jgi:hypothetical protein